MFLPFNQTLLPATFLVRDNRFILTCKLEESNETIKVHLQDPGRLKELLVPGHKVYVTYHDEPHRKTKWTAQLVQKPNSHILVSLRSTLPNSLIKKALQENRLEELNHKFVRQEFTFGGSRWDFLLGDEQHPYLLEVKSVTMEQKNIGYFPDAPTKRGYKHVKELIDIQQNSHYQTGILFVCQREDIEMVRAADWIDSNFAQALMDAYQSGVEIHARSCKLSLTGITLGEVIPVQL